jgi:hypothetical protein
MHATKYIQTIEYLHTIADHQHTAVAHNNDGMLVVPFHTLLSLDLKKKDRMADKLACMCVHDKTSPFCKPPEHAGVLGQACSVWVVVLHLLRYPDPCSFLELPISQTDTFFDDGSINLCM